MTKRIVLFVLAVALIAAVGIIKAPAADRCLSSAMARLAQEHANDMAARGGPRCTYARLNHDGFFSRRGPAGARAENVACAGSEAQAIAMWWRSPGHAANMRLAGCWGIASNGRYWVLDIGE